jgi:hypothetical protein
VNYQERAEALTAQSSIAVMVVGCPERGAVEFLMLKPKPLEPSGLTGVWQRDFRSIGTLGLVGCTACAALKEPLEPRQVDTLAVAFLEYVRVLLTPRNTGDEIEWCERLYALEDPRPDAKF